jgi:ABC-type nitrate/sulfonate/bicarbonate transport system substrate-binding protein
MTSLAQLLKKYPDDRNRAVKETMEQLRGKKVGVPQGTPYEQMLLAALKLAGMDPKKDIDLRYVKLADGLPAFLAGDLDVVGAGVTQRTEAMRYGHQLFLDMESFGFAEIIGIVTTEHFARQHQKQLDALVGTWFESVNRLMSDVDTFSKAVLDYLDKNSSTKYTLTEYKEALTFQEFPRNLADARALMMQPSGKFYWKRTWDIVNDYLVETKKAERPIPVTYFMGETVDRNLGK